MAAWLRILGIERLPGKRGVFKGLLSGFPRLWVHFGDPYDKEYSTLGFTWVPPFWETATYLRGPPLIQYQPATVCVDCPWVQVSSPRFENADFKLGTERRIL